MLLRSLRSLLLAVLLAGAARASGASDSGLIGWEELQAQSSQVTEAIERHLSELQEAQNEESNAESKLSQARMMVGLGEGVKDYMAGTKGAHDEYASEIGKAKAAVEAFRGALEDPSLPKAVQSLAEQASALERVYDSATSAWTTWWAGPGKRHKALKDLEAAEKEAERLRKHAGMMESQFLEAEQRLSDAENNVQVVTELMEPHHFVANDANFEELKDALRNANAELSLDQSRAASAAVDFFRSLDDPHLAEITEEIASDTPGAKYAKEIIGDIEKLRQLTEDQILEYITRYQDEIDVLEGDESQSGSIKQLEATLDATRAAATSAERKLASLKTKAIPVGPEVITEQALEGGRTAPEAAEGTLMAALDKPEIREAVNTRPTLRAVVEQCKMHIARRQLLSDIIKSPEKLNSPDFAKNLELGRRKLRETEARVERAKETIEDIEGRLKTVRDREQVISKQVTERQANTAALAAAAGL